MERLRIPPQQSRARPSEAVREISWAEFGEVAHALAERIATQWRPDAILGVVHGGVFIGGTLAGHLNAEFIPAKVDKTGRAVRGERLPSLAGKRVLAVDDVSQSGRTLAAARTLATKAGAVEVRTAALVVRPKGSRPDFHAIETSQVVVFGWDYQLHADAGGSAVDPGDVGV